MVLLLLRFLKQPQKDRINGKEKILPADGTPGYFSIAAGNPARAFQTSFFNFIAWLCGCQGSFAYGTGSLWAEGKPFPLKSCYIQK
jgi:hypothetical protein